MPHVARVDVTRSVGAHKSACPQHVAIVLGVIPPDAFYETSNCGDGTRDGKMFINIAAERSIRAPHKR